VLNDGIFESVVKQKVDECFKGTIVSYELKYTYPKLGERDLVLSYYPIEGPTGIDRIACVLEDVTERRRAEHALRESEDRAESILDSVTDMHVSFDRDWRHIYVNRAGAAMVGLPREQILGKNMWELFPDLAGTEMERQGRRAMDLRVAVAFDFYHPSRDLWLDCRLYPTPQGLSVFTTDITQRKRAEEALRESEARERAKSRELEAVLEALPIAVCIAHDIDCLHMTGNRAAHEQLAVPLGSNISLSAAAEDRPAFRLLENGAEIPPELMPIQQAAATGKPVYGRPLTVLLPNGSKRETIANVVPLLDEQARPRGAVAASIDVTEQKQAEEALRRSEQRFRVALAGSPIKVFNQDRDLRYTWVYNLQEGWSEKDYLGKTDAEIFDPEVAERMTAMKRSVLESGCGIRTEFPLEAHGKTYHCDITVEPLVDASGSVVGVNCACVDVTHLREISEELRLAKEKLSEEKLYLEQTIDSELGFGEIIGRSRGLKEVMQKVASVAPSGAAVLLLGETGTGKELVARAIHRMSKRQENSFIKMNCAAIPSSLLESELFGHEKGAFTGSVSRKIGRLELADQGTLFLDEIGEIPLELQPKLLRVLQDREFERLGGIRTINVDFRLVAATNRDLRKSVNEQQFRSDLYYRLNVFPIHIPPLRERREDIPLLVEHFVHKYAERMSKSIASIPAKTMDALVSWPWPGNIRELENFLERSVILTRGSVLQAPLGQLDAQPDMDKDTGATLRERERAQILRALRECRGQIGGPEGAAVRLGLKRTTLQSKLGHFSIKPEEYRE
jgi:PAS domain S-box-containing protein